MAEVIDFENIRKLKNNKNKENEKGKRNKYDLFIDIIFYDYEIESVAKMYNYYKNQCNSTLKEYGYHFKISMAKTLKTIMDNIVDKDNDYHTITINVCELLYLNIDFNNALNNIDYFTNDDLKIFRDVIDRLKPMYNQYSDIINDFQNNTENEKICIMENVLRNFNQKKNI